MEEKTTSSSSSSSATSSCMYTVCLCTLCSDLASSSTLFKFCADRELCREVTIQTTLRCENSTVSGSPKLRSAERTRKERLHFLDETPSFRPKIIQQVPDFSRLHKALQTEALRKTQSKETIKCQPFHLRTSALPERKSRMSPENSQVNVVLTCWPVVLFTMRMCSKGWIHCVVVVLLACEIILI